MSQYSDKIYIKQYVFFNSDRKQQSRSIFKHNMQLNNTEPKSIPDVHSVYENETDLTVTIKDLDSGVQKNLDPQFIPKVDQIRSIQKQSVWEQYWRERQQMDKILFRIINSNNTEKLLEIVQAHTVNFDDYKYMDGWTLLHHAVSMNHYNITVLLVLNGAQINRVTQSMKRTALHLSVLNNNQEITQFLLNQEADANIQDVDFCTPVHYAVEYSHIRLVKLFLKYKNIDFTVMNNKKMTPLDCCRDGRVKLLIQQYCGIKTTYSPSKIYQRRYLQIDGQSMVTKTRADYVQHMLSLKQPNLIKNTVSEQQYNRQNAVKQLRKNKSVIGGKINSIKLNLINSIAKQSLCSYHDSLIENNYVESLQDYDIIKKIGSGSFGSVFLARKKKASKLYAIKRLDKNQIIKNKLKKYIYTQRQILKNINHPFIIHGYSFFQDSWHLYMVMDFCPGGDLENQKRKNTIPEDVVRIYCCQIVLALETLHKQNYLFRDLKPANVLTDEDGHIKLIDFGLAKQTELSYSFLGSVAYLAPEMLADSDNKMHGPEMDWYLLGVFCYELLTGYPPFYNKNIAQMHSDIRSKRPKIPSNFSKQCQNFLEQILIKNPKKRLGYKGAPEIKQHQWFKDIQWKDILNKKIQVPKPSINQKQLRKKQYVELEQHEEHERLDCFLRWDHLDHGLIEN